MMNERKTWSPFSVADLEPVWEQSDTYLQELHDWTRTMKVQSKGWPEDPIFKSIMKLEKGEGSENP